MQLALSRVGVAEEHKMLPSADLGTGITAGDHLHTLDAFGYTHLGIKDGTVEVHTTDIVGGERGVLQFYPGFTVSELIHDAGGVVGQYLVNTDVPSTLAEHRRGTE